MIVELRQYTLRPGTRDDLIALFDSEFVESQEACGITIFGQFRDLDDPDRFVWLRGFDTMSARAEALNRFYYGPVWKAHAAAANATMIDSDDVLLLRPASARSMVRSGPRPPVDTAEVSVVRLTLYYADRPFDDTYIDRLPDGIWLRTEYAENTFPALPIRTGEHVLVRVAPSRITPDGAEPVLHCDGPRLRTQSLRLEPTARSLLR